MRLTSDINTSQVCTFPSQLDQPPIGNVRYVSKDEDIQVITESSDALERSIGELGASSQDESLYSTSMEDNPINRIICNPASSHVKDPQVLGRMPQN